MVLMFFNERSCVSNATQDEARQAMLDFIKVCQAVWQIHRGTTLVSEVRLEDVEISPGYYLQQWRNEPANHDAWQFMRRTLQRKAPLSGVLPRPPEDQESEYRHEGDPVLGLAAAHLMKMLAVSLPTGPRWAAPWLKVDYEILDDDVLTTDSANVHHASEDAHVREHEDWIRTTAASATTSGVQLWEERDTLFPYLQFVPGVEQNLRELPGVAVANVRAELVRLNTAAENWKPGESEPSWAVKVVPESDTRIHMGLVDFTDLDGVKRTFSPHVRYQPHQGRIHFRLIAEEGRIRVGYVGRKRLTAGVPRNAR
ncbi:hypothetical protein SGL43_05103 [Streptomyces globisporus]|uniref:Uncharacterized protein n=1 Tax=Streptomyces globisporus TaxID=1908 RepID=A0ABM9H387_STRGL|nr:hypothetical protein [Streptomyces globisporus]CAH9418055.1 hypothetical protein SGL43_05103 [Streptomyces globisporus]